MSKLKTAIAATRPPFLILSIITVLLGAATAYHESSTINYLMLCLALLGAISAHISVNALNEYFDFKSGLDLLTEKTPFSGGSGALPANPNAAWLVLATALLFLALTIAVGIYFLRQYGLALLPLGLLGVLIVISYTPYLNRHPLLCLFAPGTGLGLLMVAGSHFVIAGHYSPLALLVALPPFFLANNLLLLNQFPDMDADRQSGRRTLPIVYGYRTSSRIYGLFLLLAAVSLLLTIISGHLPSLTLLALLPLIPGLSSYRTALQFSGDTPTLLSAMQRNVMVATTTPLVIALTLLFA